MSRVRKQHSKSAWPGKSISAPATFANCGRADDITKIQKNGPKSVWRAHAVAEWHFLIHFPSAPQKATAASAWLCRLWSRGLYSQGVSFPPAAAASHSEEPREQPLLFSDDDVARRVPLWGWGVSSCRGGGWHSLFFILNAIERAPPRKRPSGGAGPKLLEEAALWLARLDLYRRVAINFTQQQCAMRFSAVGALKPFAFNRCRWYYAKTAAICMRMRAATCVCSSKHTISGAVADKSIFAPSHCSRLCFHSRICRKTSGKGLTAIFWLIVCCESNVLYALG